jgi:hypothetical protein
MSSEVAGLGFEPRGRSHANGQDYEEWSEVWSKMSTNRDRSD